MSKLIGTEKQVAWAENIRGSRLADFRIAAFWAEWNENKAEFLALYEDKEEWLKEVVAEATVKSTANMEAALARLTNSTSAKFWINNRHIKLSNMVNNEEEFPEA